MNKLFRIFHFSPLTLRRLQRFKSMKRGYYSSLILCALIMATFFAEIIASNRALLVRYQGHFYFPTYTEMKPGSFFGLDYDYETNYRELKKLMASQRQKFQEDDFVLLAPIPYGPLENDFSLGSLGAPNFETRHFLGTDAAGRDVLARIIYGFRIGIAFAAALALFEYVLGVFLGLTMGYFGGAYDLIAQRIVEIWSNVPTLYIVIIVASFVAPGFISLLCILLLFGWISKTQYMRALAYQEKSRDYVLAARAIGFSSSHIMFRQILPNTIALIVTLFPFTIEASFTALTVYDYLGFGLPPPTPSWGELLRQGTANLRNAPWLTFSVVGALVLLLVMITFVGEALREAFDPKRFSVYE